MNLREIQRKQNKLNLSYQQYLDRYPNLQGYEFDNYKILDLIAQIEYGSYTQIYKGINKLTKQQVVVKLFNKKDLTSEQNSQVKIQKQIIIDKQSKLLWEFNSPHITKCYESFQNDDFKITINEYCNEGTLQNLIQKGSKLDQKQCIKIFKQIVTGLKQFHKKGYFFKYLTPQNIQLHNGHCKIDPFSNLSFSLFAKSLKYFKDNNYLAKYYSAPNSLNNPYSSQSCLWSLGVILFQILFGKRISSYAQNPQTTGQLILSCYNSCQQTASLRLSKKTKNLFHQIFTLDQTKRMTIQQLQSFQLYQQQDIKCCSCKKVIVRGISQQKINALNKQFLQKSSIQCKQCFKQETKQLISLRNFKQKNQTSQKSKMDQKYSFYQQQNPYQLLKRQNQNLKSQLFILKQQRQYQMKRIQQLQDWLKQFNKQPKIKQNDYQNKIKGLQEQVQQQKFGEEYYQQLSGIYEQKLKNIEQKHEKELREARKRCEYAVKKLKQTQNLLLAINKQKVQKKLLPKQYQQPLNTFNAFIDKIYSQCKQKELIQQTNAKLCQNINKSIQNCLSMLLENISNKQKLIINDISKIHKHKQIVLKDMNTEQKNVDNTKSYNQENSLYSQTQLEELSRLFDSKIIEKRKKLQDIQTINKIKNQIYDTKLWKLSDIKHNQEKIQNLKEKNPKKNSWETEISFVELQSSFQIKQQVANKFQKNNKIQVDNRTQEKNKSKKKQLKNYQKLGFNSKDSSIQDIMKRLEEED